MYFFFRVQLMTTQVLEMTNNISIACQSPKVATKVCNYIKIQATGPLEYPLFYFEKGKEKNDQR
jgi:hypothetical protein